MAHLVVYSQHTHSTQAGCTEQLRLVQTNCNVSLPMFPRISPRLLHFPRFRNHRAHVCHYNGSAFTHLYTKGTPHSPQGWISLTSKPPFMTSTDLSVGVSAVRHPPPFQYSNRRISTTSNHRIKEAPALTFWSVTISKHTTKWKNLWFT